MTDTHRGWGPRDGVGVESGGSNTTPGRSSDLGPAAKATDGPGSRAVVPVLGVMLLLGFVIVASIGVFVLAAEGLASSQSDAESDRIEQSFTEFSAQADVVGKSSQDVRTVNFDLAGGEAIRKDRTGHVTVSVSGESEPLVDEPMTSVEYVDGEEVIAYQAGGVWRGTGSGTQLLSAPDVGYEPGTLSLPVLNVTGERQLSGDRLTMASGETTTPLDDLSAVDGKIVTVEIESEYYGGWAEYFKRQTTDAAVTVDHDAQTVEVVLGQPELEGDYKDSVVAQGSVQTAAGSACIDGNVTASGDVSADDCQGGGPNNQIDGGDDDVTLRPIDEVINMSVERASDEGEEIEDETLDGGTYFVDGDLHRQDTELTLDVSDENVAIVVDGHVAFENTKIRVVGSDSENTASVYTTGDVAFDGGNGGVSVADGGADGFQLYGTSELQFAIGQGEFEGTVYAPRDGPTDRENEAVAKYGLDSSAQCAPVDGQYPDVCIGQGSVDVTGSITSGSMSVEQGSTFEHDPSLADVEPTFSLEGIVMPPELTYLHVVVHDVDVSGR